MENKRKLYKLSAKFMPIFCKDKINQTLARLTKKKKITTPKYNQKWKRRHSTDTTEMHQGIRDCCEQLYIKKLDNL